MLVDKCESSPSFVLTLCHQCLCFLLECELPGADLGLIIVKAPELWADVTQYVAERTKA